MNANKLYSQRKILYHYYNDGDDDDEMMKMIVSTTTLYLYRLQKKYSDLAG